MQMPPVIKTLLLLNIAAYLIDSLFSHTMGLQLAEIFGLYYVGHPSFRLYQLLTYMFMHEGFTHLFFNMFALWMFGRIMEGTWGGQRFLIYYIICGIGAALVQEIGQAIDWINPYAMTIGASGAVYGILLAFGMTFPNERLFIIPFPFPIKAKWFVCLYAVIEIIEGISSHDGVAHFAHLGGMFFGLLLILYWRRSALHSNVNFGRNFWTQTVSRPTMHVSYNGKHVADYEYNAQQKARNEEVDRILDKVRMGGYQSLTENEKQTLFDASKR
ncbi:MAG: rhomboid family intramembrane serine protease [Bacteroidaceae bacterium]|nr:rhomboid family intramembrane serine protease [Bacteroidaceae bacterium]